MSNLRSDCRALVKDLPPGDTMRSHVEALCNQIDLLEEDWHSANQRILEIRRDLEKVVCTEGRDSGVVLLSQEGPTHPEDVGGHVVQVYDHDYFSPLGDALIALHTKCETQGMEM